MLSDFLLTGCSLNVRANPRSDRVRRLPPVFEPSFSTRSGFRDPGVRQHREGGSPSINKAIYCSGDSLPEHDSEILPGQAQVNFYDDGTLRRDRRVVRYQARDSCTRSSCVFERTAESSKPADVDNGLDQNRRPWKDLLSVYCSGKNRHPRLRSSEHLPDHDENPKVHHEPDPCCRSHGLLLSFSPSIRVYNKFENCQRTERLRAA